MAKKRAYTSTFEDYDISELNSLYDKSFDTNINPKVGDEFNGTVIAITSTHAMVDIGARQEAFIEIQKESQTAKSYLVPGEKVEVTVTEVNEPTRTTYGIVASIDKSLRKGKLQELIDSIGQKNVAYEAKIEQLVDNAGYIVSIDEFKAFMPGSLSSMNLIANFRELVGKVLPVMVISYAKESDTIIVSHKEYLNQLIPSEISSLERDKWYCGKVTGLSKFGIFVEFNSCLTGLIYKTDIKEDLQHKFLLGSIQIGEEIEFKVKDVVNNKRIILTQTNTPDPWRSVEENYTINNDYDVKLVKKKDYGTFFELEPGLMGFCNDQFSDSVGSIVRVRLNRIDVLRRKISLLRILN